MVAVDHAIENLTLEHQPGDPRSRVAREDVRGPARADGTVKHRARRQARCG